MPSQSSSSSIAWPEDYAGLQDILKDRLGGDASIYIHRTISGGKSGAQVMVADVNSETFTGQAILKLDTTSRAHRSETLEHERHEHAFEVAPEFAQRHLPRLVCAVRLDDMVAALTTIAGRGLEYASDWGACSYGPQLDTALRLSDDLLHSWNADYSLDDELRMPEDLLSEWLDHRLVRERGSRIHEFIETRCALPASASTFVFDGDWFPNPLVLGSAEAGLPDTARLRAIRGNQHGDLHGRNVLVTKQTQVDPHYYLIDLDYYRDDGFLFYDHAIFELDYLLTSRDLIRPKHWKTIMLNLVRDQSKRINAGLFGADIGIIQLVQAFREKPWRWIDQHQPNRLSFLESQYLLAQVAAGLAVTHQRRNDRSRALAFLYAAYAAKDYLDLHDFEWPRHGPEFGIEKLYEEVAPGKIVISDHRVRDLSQPGTRPPELALAVLPLNPSEPSAENQQLTDSLTDSLIAELSRIDWFNTVGRTALHRFNDKPVDPREAGRLLDARYVLQGSFRQQDEVPLISVHLFETSSGNDIWSDRFKFEPESMDRSANEDSIVQAIAGMLNAVIADNERALAMECDPEQATSWQLQERARWHYLQVSQEDDELALRFARKAIELAPDSSDSYALIAQVQNRSIFNGWTEASDEVLASSVNQARHAVALSPRNSYAHECLARAYMFSGQAARAVREAETAVSLNPSSATAHLGLATCLVWAGKPAEALPVIDLALQLGPFNDDLVYKLSVKAVAYFMLGRTRMARELGDKMLDSTHGHMIPHLFRALTLGRQGREDEARAEIQLVLKDRPDMSCSKLRGMFSGLNPILFEPLLQRFASLGLPEQSEALAASPHPAGQGSE